MRNRGLYAAAALFLLAVGAFYIYDKGQSSNAPGSTPSASPRPVPTPIVSIDPNQISQVDVKAKAKVLTVVRNNTTFTYTVCPTDQTNCQPQIADPAVSIQLFTSVVQLGATRTIFGVSDQLPNFGLDKPTGGEIDIKTGSGKTTIIWIGAKAPDNVSVYVRRPDGGDVFAVPAASIDVPILGLVDNPPVPRPSPSPGAAASPSSAQPAGPLLNSP
jgi:hypothetical protein